MRFAMVKKYMGSLAPDMFAESIGALGESAAAPPNKDQLKKKKIPPIKYGVVPSGQGGDMSDAMGKKEIKKPEPPKGTKRNLKLIDPKKYPAIHNYSADQGMKELFYGWRLYHGN